MVRQTLAAVAALPERQRDALLAIAVEGRGQDDADLEPPHAAQPSPLGDAHRAIGREPLRRAVQARLRLTLKA